MTSARGSFEIDSAKTMTLSREDVEEEDNEDDAGADKICIACLELEDEEYRAVFT